MGPWLESGSYRRCFNNLGQLFGDLTIKSMDISMRYPAWYMCTRSLFVYVETSSFSRIYVRWMLELSPCSYKANIASGFVRYFRGGSPVMIICLKDED
jgi:hypothetical protein